MHKENITAAFNQEHAASYDRGNARFAPLLDALHFLIRLVLADLPANARILCVGVGTGSELVNLALAFPEWRFTAVEPAPAMLNICRQRAEEHGIASRCIFHEGYLDSLPASDAFDAATCLLVSHFILQQQERYDFFHQIAARLRPGGYLINADIASDMTAAAYQNVLEFWVRMLKSPEMSEAKIAQLRAVYGRDVAVLPPSKIETLLTSAGFESPTLFFQTLLIHAWHSRRS